MWYSCLDVYKRQDDPFESAQDMAAFESEMRTSGVDWQLIKYGGAVHSFTQPNAGNDNSKGAAYNERADKRSWEAMTLFFAEILETEWNGFLRQKTNRWLTACLLYTSRCV